MTTKATNPSFGATKPEANVANPSFGAKPEANVANPYGTNPQVKAANPSGATPETNVANPSFGAKPENRTANSNVESPEVRAHGGTPEGNTNNPYGTKPENRTANSKVGTPENRTANPSFGATKPVTESEQLKTIRFGAGQIGGAAKQPLSMVSYKMFLRTGMYYTNKLQGDPLTLSGHTAARDGFNAEITALKAQVIAKEQNQALRLEFEPLRNNYWLNNNGYDQVYI